jgi:hypothetical protein
MIVGDWFGIKDWTLIFFGCSLLGNFRFQDLLRFLNIVDPELFFCVSKLLQRVYVDVNKTVVKWLSLILIIKIFDSDVWSSPFCFFFLECLQRNNLKIFQSKSW